MRRGLPMTDRALSIPTSVAARLQAACCLEARYRKVWCLCCHPEPFRLDPAVRVRRQGGRPRRVVGAVVDGILLAVLPDPRDGLFFRVVPGYALVYATDSKLERFATGFGVAAGAGYDWWIGDEWSMGVAGRFVGREREVCHACRRAHGGAAVRRVCAECAAEPHASLMDGWPSRYANRDGLS